MNYDPYEISKDTREIEDTAQFELILSHPIYMPVDGDSNFNRYNLSDEEKDAVAWVEKQNNILGFSKMWELVNNHIELIPNQIAYVWHGMMSFSKHCKNEDVDIKEIMWRTIENRLARTWRSKLIEFHTEMRLKELYPSARVISSHMIDLILGVDIVVEIGGQRFYLHLLKNSTYSNASAKNKSKLGYLIEGYRDGQPVTATYKREFEHSSHLFLKFDMEETFTTKTINGNVLFKDDYLKRTLEEAIRDKRGEVIGESGQISKFYHWLKLVKDRNPDFVL